MRGGGTVSEAQPALSERRLPDRCLQCGRFVGFYPVGFHCDTHCYSCVCNYCDDQGRETPMRVNGMTVGP